MKSQHVKRHKRMYRKLVEQSTERNMAIYMRATERGSADYLTVNQPSEAERVDKILSLAHARRVRKNERNKRNVR